MFYRSILFFGMCAAVFGAQTEIHGMIIDRDGDMNANRQPGSSLGTLKKLDKSNNAVVAEYDSGKARVEVFKTGIVHLTIQRGSVSRKSFAVIESPEELSSRKIGIEKEKVSVSLDEGTVSYLPSTLGFSFFPKNGSSPLDLTEIQFDDSGFVAIFDIHGARNFYGLGEKTSPYNKYGSRATMWNSDFPAYSVKLDPLYESIPFILKADPNGTYGLFFDNTFRSTFDVGASDSNKLLYRTEGGAFELYLITGKNAAEVVQRFSELTGEMPMPPVWALGYQQSRWSYYPEQKVLDLAHGFRERNIPCDVIYLDINYMDGYKCFTWSPKDFPTPKEMLDTLHELGFRVVTIIDPGIKDEKGYQVYDSGLKEDVFVKKPDEEYFVGQVWPGDCAFPDFLNQKTRKWWGDQYKSLLDYGVDGFWNDMNEPSVFNTPNKTFPLDVMHRLDVDEGAEGEEHGANITAEHSEIHNIYGMQMARATREGLERLEPNKRPLVLTRANYAGGQRYAAIWTGDNFASYAHLKLALVMFLNIGVSGQPFVGSDVGGFIGNPGAELFTRWLELGAFSPFFRTHSVINSSQREPWAFDSESTKTNREIINRRYELLPEIYTAFRKASDDGLPIARPLYLDFPGEEEAYKISDEFLFGKNLLVAPVLDSGVVARKVYFPKGTWISIRDRRSFDAGWHEVDAPIGKTPVFVRDGTIIFTQSLVQSTSEQADTLILQVFGDRTARGDSHFDDGGSISYKDGDFLDMSLSYESGARGAVLTFGSKGNYRPRYKFLAVELTAQSVKRIAVMKTRDRGEFRGEISNTGNGSVRFTFPFSTEVESISIK